MSQRLLHCTREHIISLTLQRHRLHRQSHEEAIHHSTHCSAANIQAMSYYFPVTDRRRRRAIHSTIFVSQTSTRRAANATPSHERGVAILTPGVSLAARSIVVQPRAVDCHDSRPSLQVVYRKRIVDLAGTRSIMCCCYRTAPTAFTWTSRSMAKSVTAMEYYCWHSGQKALCDVTR